MLKNKVVMNDPVRPLRGPQAVANIKFVCNLLGLSESSGLFLHLNDRFDTWALNFKKWSDEVNFGDRIDEFKDSLIICYEMSPAFVEYCISKNIPFLSLAINPVRFMSDLLVTYVTNVSEISDALAVLNVDEDAIYSVAKSICRQHLSQSNVPTVNGKIIVEQLPLDASTIVRGKFLGLTDVVRHFNLKSYRILHHPFSNTTSFRGVRVNPYKLLAVGRDVEIYGISSSLLYEARYFSVTANRIHDPVRDVEMLGAMSGRIGVDGINTVRKLLEDQKGGGTAGSIESVRSVLGFSWARK